jgi:hypothetical protein
MAPIGAENVFLSHLKLTSICVGSEVQRCPRLAGSTQETVSTCLIARELY